MTSEAQLHPNIVLTGFMGTGKSTVGRILAERLGVDLIDTDALIEQAHGPIPAIFTTQGEAAFREMEREVARTLAGQTGQVISTGGRFMLDPLNAEALAPTSRIFSLTASAEEIFSRVTGDGSGVKRPLLDVDNPLQRIEQLLEARAAGYDRFTQIETGHRSPAEIADEILDRIAHDSHTGA